MNDIGDVETVGHDGDSVVLGNADDAVPVGDGSGGDDDDDDAGDVVNVVVVDDDVVADSHEIVEKVDGTVGSTDRGTLDTDDVSEWDAKEASPIRWNTAAPQTPLQQLEVDCSEVVLRQGSN